MHFYHAPGGAASVGHRVSGYRFSRVLAGLLAVGFSAASLAGCALDFTGSRPTQVSRRSHAHKDTARTNASSAIALPDQVLLKPQPPPDCASKGARPDDTELAIRIRDAYELACYRNAEAFTRERLRQLQAWADRALEGIERDERRKR